MAMSDQAYEELKVLSDRVKAQQEQERERQEREARSQSKTIEVLICPTPGCPGYYGATLMDAMGPQEDDWTGLYGLNGEPQPPDRARTRGDCWVCHEAGRGRVPMNRVRVTIDPGERKEPQPRPTTGRFAA